MASEFDYGIARQYFGACSPQHLIQIIRAEAPMTLHRAANAIPDEESRFRIWLAAYAFGSILDPHLLLSDVRYIARAEALIAVHQRLWPPANGRAGDATVNGTTGSAPTG
jgi:hypothetical protein|tara:strand:- start:23989 stop:24318 length:330 start_codon:yes stop_codon:yes gene_type:complete